MIGVHIPYGRQWVDESDIDSVVSVLRSDWITQGSKVKEFEERIASYCGAKYAVAVSSGTAALHIACLAAGIGKGDEVITSPITFVASANCVLYCGGKPIFADIQSDTINVDPLEIKKKITKKTKAIIPVDFAGHPCDLDEISKIAKKNNLIVIEDASHALSAEYKDTKVGCCKYSDMTIFSFHPVKIITTGEGGMVTTNNKEYYEKLLLFRNHGIAKDNSKFKIQNSEPWHYEMQGLGYNYKMTDFQSALGMSQLKKIDNFLKERRKIAYVYNDVFAGLGNFVVLPSEKNEVFSSWHIYVIKLKNKLKQKRREIFEKLQKCKIGVQVHYIPIHFQPYYRDSFGHKLGSCPKAEDYYERAITLPLFPKMSKEEIDYVIKSFTKIVLRLSKIRVLDEDRPRKEVEKMKSA